MNIIDLGRLRKIEIAVECAREAITASVTYPPFNSVHEGYAIIKEEFDELWDIIKMKEQCRDNVQMRLEAIHLGAMAIRFIYDLLEKKGENYG